MSGGSALPAHEASGRADQKLQRKTRINLVRSEPRIERGHPEIALPQGNGFVLPGEVVANACLPKVFDIHTENGKQDGSEQTDRCGHDNRPGCQWPNQRCVIEIDLAFRGFVYTRDRIKKPLSSLQNHSDRSPRIFGRIQRQDPRHSPRQCRQIASSVF